MSDPQEVTLEMLRNLTARKNNIDTEWRDAIVALGRIHSVRVIAREAGVSHGSVHRFLRADRKKAGE